MLRARSPTDASHVEQVLHAARATPRGFASCAREAKGEVVLLRAVVVAVFCLGATASTNPFCAGALHAQQNGQDAVMPPEGNPDHVQPPDGAYCDHSRRAAHACACHAQCVEDSDGNVTVQEDGAHCRANCFKKHCHCPTDKCQTPPQ